MTATRTNSFPPDLGLECRAVPCGLAGEGPPTSGDPTGEGLAAPGSLLPNDRQRRALVGLGQDGDGFLKLLQSSTVFLAEPRGGGLRELVLELPAQSVVLGRALGRTGVS
jgi:hypothetical protein